MGSAGHMHDLPRPEAGLGVDHLSVTALFGAPLSLEGPLCRPRPDTVQGVVVGGARGGHTSSLTCPEYVSVSLLAVVELHIVVG